MSSIQGAKAISAVTNGKVREVKHARTFEVVGSQGDLYSVTVGARPGARPALAGHADTCSCPAGRRDARCWHVQAARLQIRAEREMPTRMAARP